MSPTGRVESMDQIISGTTIMANLYDVRTANIIKMGRECVPSIMRVDMQKHGSALMERGEMMMPDREKVIKGLEYHLKELSVGKTCFECNYCGDNPCEIHLITDALSLLKEQQKLIDDITQRRTNNGAFD